MALRLRAPAAPSTDNLPVEPIRGVTPKADGGATGGVPAPGR
jgi:hypothetical protein